MMKGVQSLCVSVCVRHVHSVSVLRRTAGTRPAVAVANVSHVPPVHVVAAVNVVRYSNKNDS